MTVAALPTAAVGFWDRVGQTVGTGLNTYLGYRIQRETLEEETKLRLAEARLAESQRNSPERAGTNASKDDMKFNWKPWAIGAGVAVVSAVALKKAGVF